MKLRNALSVVFVACCMCLVMKSGGHAGTIWSGPDLVFTKPSGAAPLAPENIDVLTDRVSFARGSLRGLFNASVESQAGGQNSATPTGTRWATRINNPGEDIDAANFASLTFETWFEAYGGGNIAVSVPGRQAVVHLVEESIYLNLRFTSWDAGNAGGDGGFSYVRSTPPLALLAGDYSGDGFVDAADYTVWRDQIGEPAGALPNDIDGGEIGTPQYQTWVRNFGQKGTVSSVAIPEPPYERILAALLVAACAVAGGRDGWRAITPACLVMTVDCRGR